MTNEEKILIADLEVTVTKILDLVSWYYKGIPGQTRCPVHKQGGETRPSARVYDDGLYCYTCGKQYKPTEVYSSLFRLERVESAERILEKWPVSTSRVEEILRNYTAPRVKPASEALINVAEEAVLNYKLKVPLNRYREWLFRLDDLSQVLKGFSIEEQKKKVSLFKSQLRISMEESF